MSYCRLEECASVKDLSDITTFSSFDLRLPPKCKLCKQTRRTFTCNKCVNKGDFHDRTIYKEKFSNKHSRLIKLIAFKKQKEEKCMEYYGKKADLDETIANIRITNDRIEALRGLLGVKKESQHKNERLETELMEENVERAKLLPKYKNRITSIRNYLEAQKAELANKSDQLSDIHEQLKTITRVQIRELTTDIFPIAVFQPQNSSRNIFSLNVDKLPMDLVEAQQNDCFRGLSSRWMRRDMNEVYYRIVEPILCKSGNYSDWVSVALASETTSVSSLGAENTSIRENPSYTISAALHYTAQLVNILSAMLDIPLPFDLVYSEFCKSNDMKHTKFASCVGKLNLNVLHMCFKQNVDPRHLIPTETLHNILCLLDVKISDLGKRGSMDNIYDYDSVVDVILHELHDNSDFHSDEDFLEWETVPYPRVADTGAHSPGGSSGDSSVVSNNSGSFASEFVNSAAKLVNFWRGHSN